MSIMRSTFSRYNKYKIKIFPMKIYPQYSVCWLVKIYKREDNSKELELENFYSWQMRFDLCLSDQSYLHRHLIVEFKVVWPQLHFTMSACQYVDTEIKISARHDCGSKNEADTPVEPFQNWTCQQSK